MQEIFFFFVLVVTSYGFPPELKPLKTADIADHSDSLLKLTEKLADWTYEESRKTARDLIINTLSEHNFSVGEQIILQKFNHKEKQDVYLPKYDVNEKGAINWYTGVNLLIWANKTVLPDFMKFIVIAAQYDSVGWAAPGVYPCSTTSTLPQYTCYRAGEKVLKLSEREKIFHLQKDMWSVATVLQLSLAVQQRQERWFSLVQELDAYDLLAEYTPGEPDSIDWGIYHDVPILFLLLDLHSCGGLGLEYFAENLGAEFRDRITALHYVDVGHSWKQFAEPYTSLVQQWEDITSDLEVMVTSGALRTVLQPSSIYATYYDEMLTPHDADRGYLDDSPHPNSQQGSHGKVGDRAEARLSQGEE